MNTSSRGTVTVVEAQALALPSSAAGELKCSVSIVPHPDSVAGASTLHTKSVPSGLIAKWNDNIELIADSKDKLAVESWLTGSTKDVLVGRAEIDIDSLVVGSSSDKWLALKSPDSSKPAGLLHTLIHPKIKRRASQRGTPSTAIQPKSGPSRGPTFEPSDLEKWISPEELSALDEKERSRQKAILEFIETERSYNNDLDILKKVFINPIQEKNLLTKSEMNSIFSNVESLHEVNLELMQELAELQEQKRPIKNLGEVLAKRDSIFKLYAIFCSAIVDVNQRVEQFKEKNHLFAQFLEECFRKPECRLLPLDSFIHAPLSRLVKYPLLLEAVLKYTPQDHPDKEPLEKVYGTIMEIVNMVNERTRQVENVQKLIQLQKSIANPNEPGNDFVDKQRYIIKEGPLTYLKGEGKNRKERKINLIVFNDMLVLAKHVQSRTGAQIKIGEKFLTKEISFSADVHNELLNSSSSSLERIPSADGDMKQSSSLNPLSSSSRWRTSTMRKKPITEPAAELRIDLIVKRGDKQASLVFIASSVSERVDWHKAIQNAINVSNCQQTFSFTTTSARNRLGDALSVPSPPSTSSEQYSDAKSPPSAGTLSEDQDTELEGSQESGEPRAKNAYSGLADSERELNGLKEQREEKKDKKAKKEKKEKSRSRRGSSRKKRKSSSKIERDEVITEKVDDQSAKPTDDPKEQRTISEEAKIGDEDTKKSRRKSWLNVFRKDELEEALTTEAKKIASEETNDQAASPQKKNRRKSLLSILRKDEIDEALALEAEKVIKESEAKENKKEETVWRKIGTWGRKKKNSSNSDIVQASEVDVTKTEGKKKKA